MAVNPVDELVIVTAALGTKAPDGSIIWPSNIPVGSWQNASETLNSSNCRPTRGCLSCLDMKRYGQA